MEDNFMTKVVRLALINKTIDTSGKEIDYKDVCKCLWELQKETRDLKNSVIRECWEWYNFSNDYYKLNGSYPKERDYLLKKMPDGTTKDYTLDGFIYDKYCKNYSLQSGNLSTTVRMTVAAFKNSIRAILKGEKSILSYKANQPIDVKNNSIRLDYDKTANKFSVTLGLLNKAGKLKYEISLFDFDIIAKDKSTRSILERCFDGVYKVSASHLIYNKIKKQWFLNLAYSFDNPTKELDKDRILGINLGVVYPLYASINGEHDRLYIKGDEIIEFRKRIEGRRSALKSQSRSCGDGRIGHGYKTRMKPSLKISDKIARFRDTFNHKASRSLVDYAVKNNCGTIQLEDLTGITKDENLKDFEDKMKKFLKDWSYYDLQQKIEYKAKEKGIKVIKINPAYTSLRCSKCGKIHIDNHPTREKFECQYCGYSDLHDYNASQNIALKNIDNIIDAELIACGMKKPK